MNTKAIIFKFYHKQANIHKHRLLSTVQLWEYVWLIHNNISSPSQKHPQREDYWGHVNPIGPRACYDEGKRVAETMCYAYAKQVPKRT